MDHLSLGVLTGILVPLAFFALVVLVVFFIAKYQYQTKKALLEVGRDVKQSSKPFPFLELGMMVAGIGLGLVVAMLMQGLCTSQDMADTLMGACVLLFGGAGLVSAFFIRRKIDEKK
ncbi:MAG: hypothetical protein ACK5LR_07405 [Mangrovibacterium sp.]